MAEDVSGSNVYVNPDGTITMPADIQPTATSTPVGIVYDYDGAVTDALLGQGAGGTGLCFTNATFGGPDNFSSDGHIAHALVVINGNCAQTSAQLPDVKYRLVRLLGQVLGLGWSQVNINVMTRQPVPVADDFAGFPVMHFQDKVSCKPIAICYPGTDPTQPKMDDRAAISWLYPVTAQNVASFPGKQVFSANTVRVHGSVRFVDAQGQPAQPMQGVNVVARWVNPTTGVPSRQYAAASVSGLLFRGDAGNVVNGPYDSDGQRFDRFGSDDPSVEGFFDLAGLEIPDGSNSAQYQLSVEAVDARWSAGVGPYAPTQVTPSGTAQPVVVTVTKGGDVQQDLLMPGSAIQTQDWGEPDSYDAPATLPASGDWTGELSCYGEADFYQLAAQAYRTVSVAVTALDENGAASEVKAGPVIGIWQLSDPDGTIAPASTPVPFNTSSFGLTRLDASLLAATTFRIGIADERGDGRPDFRYHARVLYADTVLPARLSLRSGTPFFITGLGFAPGLSASMGSLNVPLLAISANQLTLAAPAVAQDGVQSITVTDAASGAFSMMADVLTFGAASTDSIGLVQGSNPATAVGGQTPNPIRVRVTAADGITPVSGATVVWSTTSGMLSACGGTTTCTVLTDNSGEVWTRLTVTAAGTITVTATLAPAVYQPAKFVQTTVLGTSSALDIALTSQNRWLARGTTMDLPLVARVMSNGVPQSGKVVNYFLEKGTGSLNFPSATTDVNGYASVTMHVANLGSEVQVSACVGPTNAPCQKFEGYAVDPSVLNLVVLGGSGQLVTVGQAFQPVTLRVTDSASPPNPVQGVGVNIQSVLLRPDNDAPIESQGESSTGSQAMPVILGSAQTSVTSDADGLLSFVPSAGHLTGAIEIEITATAGSAVQTFEMESLWPVVVSGSGTQTAVAGATAASPSSEQVSREADETRSSQVAAGEGRDMIMQK